MDTAASAWAFVQAKKTEPLETLLMPALFFEDFVPGSELVSSPHVVDRDELMQFARTWDPVPFHVDEAAGQDAFGGLTAPGLYMLAIKQRLIHTLPQHQIIASLGYDEVRFHLPMRPGDTIRLKESCLERRESRSKPDRGIVSLKFSLLNQHDEIVMSHLDTILVRRKFAAATE
jgi:acyl dehydratase